MKNKKIIYVDLDDTLCDYKEAYMQVKESSPDIEFPQSQSGFYESLKPLADAIESFEWLCKQESFDVYILTAPSLYNPLCYTEKRRWVERHLGFEHVNRLIISYHKNLLLGDYLIDDRVEGRGQEGFKGELIQFGESGLGTWREITSHISKNIINKTRPETQMFRQHSDILCFRAFDLRDRFPEPVATFEKALELLQSDRAYLPEMSGEIVCYLKSGESIKIPNTFFLYEENRFALIEEATEWVNERAKDIKPLLGAAIANQDLPLEEQIKEAMLSTETLIITPSLNLCMCQCVNEWLNKTIDGMSKESANKVKPQKNKRLSEVLESYKSAFPDRALSAEELEKKAKDDESTLLFFKTSFDDLKSPKRWVITSRDYGLTAITGNAYFDVVNNHWTPRISEATCIKDKNIADAIIESFGEDNYASVIEHYISQKELAKTAIQLENDPAVIHYHEETDTYLYEERNYFSDYGAHAMISLSNPDQFTIQKNHPAPCQLYVSIPDIAMDELAKAWCKHRKIEGDFK